MTLEEQTDALVAATTALTAYTQALRWLESWGPDTTWKTSRLKIARESWAPYTGEMAGVNVLNERIQQNMGFHFDEVVRAALSSLRIDAVKALAGAGISDVHLP